MHHTLSSASPNELLDRMRAALGIVGTEAVDILGLFQEGAKHYYSGSFSLAEARKLKVAVGEVLAITYEHPPERLCLRSLNASHLEDSLRFLLGKDNGPSSNTTTQAADEALSTPVEAEAAANEARRQWKSRFRARVRMMEKLLASAPDDNVPTPRGDGDD